MKHIPFVKMQGAGNDYVYVDLVKNPQDYDWPALAIQISDRHFGVGSDGLILIHPSTVADARMQMFNSDGSEGQMCGNGVRCVAKYVYENGISRQNPVKIETGRGVLTLELLLENGKVTRVRVDMGEPLLAAAQIPVLLEEGQSASRAGVVAPAGAKPLVDCRLNIAGREFVATLVSMGNPHCVIFQDQILDEDVWHWGPLIERSHYFPERTNVEFVQIISRSEVIQRTWERGSGETLACGTGASAVVVAGALSGRTDRQVKVNLRGGELLIDWNTTTGHVFKTGPAVEVFRGQWTTMD